MAFSTQEVLQQAALLLSFDYKQASRAKGFWGKLGLFRVLESLAGRLTVFSALFGIIPIFLFSISQFDLTTFFYLHTVLFIFTFFCFLSEQASFSLFPREDTPYRYLPVAPAAVLINRFLFVFFGGCLIGLVVSLPGSVVIMFKAGVFPGLIFVASVLINVFFVVLVASFCQIFAHRLFSREISAELAGYFQVFLLFFFLFSLNIRGFFFLGIRKWGLVTRYSINPMTWLSNMNVWGFDSGPNISIWSSVSRLALALFFLLCLNLGFLWRGFRTTIPPRHPRPKKRRSWTPLWARVIRAKEETGFGLGARLMFRDPLFRARVFPLLLFWLLNLVFLHFRSPDIWIAWPWAVPVFFVYGLFAWGIEPAQALHIGRSRNVEQLFHRLGEENLQSIQYGILKSSFLLFLLPLILLGGLGFWWLLGGNFLIHLGFGLLFLPFYLMLWFRPASWIPFSNSLHTWYNSPGFNKLLLLLFFYWVHLALAFAVNKFFIQ